MLWTKLDIKGSKTLFIGAYYRPHENDEESLNELEKSLARLSQQHNIILGGDFNFPGWDWKTNTLKPCTLHNQFRDYIDDHGLYQLVEEPTRQENTLDLMITRNPTLIHKVSVIPGDSDHDCPVVELDTKPTRQNIKPRKVLQYGKADWGAFEEHVKQISMDITTHLRDMSISDVWGMFVSGIETGIKNYIPQKMIKPQKDLPWVTSKIEKLMKKKDRLSSKIKQKRRNFNKSKIHLQGDQL